MNTDRKTAIIVGVLYIIGTVAGILSVVLSMPILDGPDFLIRVSANENQFVIAALFVLLMGLALAMVPVMMFPIRLWQTFCWAAVCPNNKLLPLTFMWSAPSANLC